MATINVPLQPGTNRIGFCLRNKAASATTNETYHWSGFDWRTITRREDTQDQPCTIYTPAPPLVGSGSWRITYYGETDPLCLGEPEWENIWEFYEDGTIADHWLGIIEGYTWEIVGNTITITMEAGYPGGPWNVMEATVSDDCQWMDDQSLRVPTAVKWPGVIKPRTRISETVTSLDWYPTL